jgi:hypothetical protein
VWRLLQCGASCGVAPPEAGPLASWWSETLSIANLALSAS